MTSKTGSEAANEARKRAEKYKLAVKYLDSCKQFTYKELVETNNIAGNVMSEADLRRMWQQTMRTLEGPEGTKRTLRITLSQGIHDFESVAAKLRNKPRNKLEKR